MADNINEKQIVIVEDDPAMADVLKKALSNQGYNLNIIFKGNELLPILEKLNFQVQLIFLDINLPDINGLDLLKQLKENPDSEEIPVILLTNLGDISHMQQGKSLGAQDYIIKANLDYQQLKKLVTKYISDYDVQYEVSQVNHN